MFLNYLVTETGLPDSIIRKGKMNCEIVHVNKFNWYCLLETVKNLVKMKFTEGDKTIFFSLVYVEMFVSL